jgi:Uma2 family endonuclease
MSYNRSQMIATKTPAVDEFLRSGENDRSEYAQGEKWEKPLPNKYHSDLQLQLGSALVQYGRESGNGEPFSAWHHRFGPEDDKRIYVPDLAFVRAPRHTQVPDYADRASDVMIEIVSPSESASRLTAKVEFYLQNGAGSVWVVDPEERRIDVYAPAKPMRTFRESDTLIDPVLPGFALPLRDIFS